ncbi:MAG: lipocalin-like domain-containing protein [Gammaproteobacteria bacterium]|nr:lipocalin-like domain-containing protein [Gammaproteobacteria bacterium]
MMAFIKNSILGFSILIFSSRAFANLPVYPLQFPRDDGAHYADVPYSVSNMTEWWYYNGKLVSLSGQSFGYSITFFNIQIDLFSHKIVIPTLMMQLTDIDHHKVYGKFIVYPKNKTNLSTQTLDVVFNAKDLSVKELNRSHYLISELKTTQGNEIHFSLKMQPTGPILLESKDGLVPIDKGHNAYYYANTRMITSGSLQIDHNSYSLDATQSTSWMEHVWGDFLLSASDPWFFANIRLENGIDINLVNMLDHQTHDPNDVNHVNIRMPDGSNTYLTSGIKVKLSSEKPYATHAEISIENANLHLSLESLSDGQDVNGWWEGIARVEGLYNGKEVSGFGYVQITAKK